MNKIIKKGWSRFKSEVPPIIKKIQAVLTMAVSSLGAMAALSWPGKGAVISATCGYGAAGCLVAVAALQFIENTVTALETKTEVIITQTTTAAEILADTQEK